MALPERPDSALFAEVRRQLDDPRLPGVLQRHCPYLPSNLSANSLSTEVPPGCQMLEFSLRHHRDAALSVSQYFSVALQQYQTVRQIINRVFGRRDDLDVLDFACGYGRLLRFLVHSIAAERIWAAEIQAEAVDYVVDRFGVHGLQSTAVPEDFRVDKRFDVIWVASLFSHLPDGLFQRWLIRLASFLKPSGILCFSVHDQALLASDQAMPDTGLFYVAGSENETLEAEIYGTTFVTEEYVLAAARQGFANGIGIKRFPRLLAHEQDIYICSSAAGPDLSSLAGFRRGARGWLDEHRQQGSSLFLRGWSASIDDGDLDYLEVEFADQQFRIEPDEPTPNVADVLDDPRLTHCGFSCSLPWPEDQARPYLIVSAVSNLGERALVFAGQLRRCSSE